MHALRKIILAHVEYWKNVASQLSLSLKALPMRVVKKLKNCFWNYRIKAINQDKPFEMLWKKGWFWRTQPASELKPQEGAVGDCQLFNLIYSQRFGKARPTRHERVILAILTTGIHAQRLQLAHQAAVDPAAQEIRAQFFITHDDGSG